MSIRDQLRTLLDDCSGYHLQNNGPVVLFRDELEAKLLQWLEAPAPPQDQLLITRLWNPVAAPTTGAGTTVTKQPCEMWLADRVYRVSDLDFNTLAMTKVYKADEADAIIQKLVQERDAAIERVAASPPAQAQER